MEEIGILDIDTRPPPAASETAREPAFRDIPIDGETRLQEVRTTDLTKATLGQETAPTGLSLSTTIDGPVSSASTEATTYTTLSGASVWCIVVGSTVGIILLLVALIFCVKHKTREKNNGRHVAQRPGKRTAAEK